MNLKHFSVFRDSGFDTDSSEAIATEIERRQRAGQVGLVDISVVDGNVVFTDAARGQRRVENATRVAISREKIGILPS